MLIAELPTLTSPMKGEDLMVYLSTTNEAVSAILLVERRGRQMPIHYVSRSLQGAEVNYALMENLALALVYPARRLRRYFQSRAIKGQVLADFLADTIEGDDPTSEGTPISKKFLKLNEDPESLRSKEEKMAADPIEEADTWKFNSNNDVEYEALLAGLRIAIKMKVKKIHAFVDSKLVANQGEGSYEARGEKTKKYKGKVLEIVKCFDKFRISHMPREENKKADALSKLTVVQCEGLTKGVLVEELNEQSVDMAEVNIIVEEEGRT
ncbi:reverse transcriptase domain-containing protein [Tanacetum coccineum]